MEKCMYNGKVLMARDVLKFDLEDEIRLRPEVLSCCDPDCKARIFFKRGPERVAHFAHEKSCSCSYSEYEKHQSEVFVEVKEIFFYYFFLKQEEMKINVYMDVKISKDSNHYAPIVIEQDDKKLAIDIIDGPISASALEHRRQVYNKLGYCSKHIFVGEISEFDDFSDERTNNYPLRAELNKSAKNTALIYDINSRELAVYKLDLVTYKDGPFSQNYDNVFVYRIDMSQIMVAYGKLVYEGLNKAFKSWQDKKQERFKEYVRTQKLKKDIKTRSIRSMVLEDLKVQFNNYNTESNSHNKLEKKRIERQDREFKRTGKLVGSAINGKACLFDISSITINKSISADMLLPLNIEDLEAKISAIMKGDYSLTKIFVNQLYRSTDEIKQAFVNIYRRYKKLQNYTNKDNGILVLEQIIRACEIEI